MPFRAPGSGLPRVVAWPPPLWLSTPLRLPGSFESRELGPRPPAPLPQGARFLNLDVVRGLLQPCSTRGHTHRAVDPRARVRLSPHCSPAYEIPAALAHRCVTAPRAGEPRSAHDGFHRHAPLAWKTDHGSKRSRQGARALDEIVRPLLVAPRAPGSPARLASRPGRPSGSSDGPRLFLDTASRKAAPSRESRCLPSRRNPCAIENCSSRTPGPEPPYAASCEALPGSSRAFGTAWCALF